MTSTEAEGRSEQAETRARLEEMEGAYRKALLTLEEFKVEQEELRHLQQATMNLLEDVDEERRKSFDTQRALLNMLEDIEEERANVERTKSMLEAVNRELEAFSYSISHDLRAPLRAISGFSQAVREDCSALLDEEGMRYLGLIQDNAHRMGRLIDDLLAFSRLNRQPIVGARIDLTEMARTVFGDLTAHAPDRKVSFTVHPVPPAWGDAPMVRQVVENLLSNALKFTRTREEARIEFGHRTGAGGGAYYVRDNGVGFDMQYSDKLFGVFQRLHSVTEFEGTGVGLALVHRIITRHGGKVWAESEEGRGTTFYFTLPEEGPNEQDG